MYVQCSSVLRIVYQDRSTFNTIFTFAKTPRIRLERYALTC